MLKRSFRLGLRLGLLIGVLAAVAKVIQSRRAKTELGGGWTAPDTAWTPPPAPPRPVTPAPTPIAKAAPVKKPAPAKKAAAPAKKPATPANKPVAPAQPAVLWVEPSGTTCPTSHPIKAKLTSHLFQVPGMFAYDRTRPDRCYVDEGAAAADGFTRAKR